MTGGYKKIIFLFLSLWIFESKAQEYDFYIDWTGEEATALIINVHEFPNLKVRLDGKDQNIAASVVTDKNTQFTPYFHFTIGATYQVFDGSNMLFSFSPQKEIKSPNVVNSFPLADELPENFLKFYIKFDQPMATGHVYDYLHLLKDGVEIENAFIPLKPELWDTNKELLTVWIDPGRVKRDLGPNKKFGAVLEAGNAYQILISNGLKAANGANLDSVYLKTFIVVNRDEKTPSIDDWSFKIPANNSKEALELSMREAMDYATLNFLSIFHNGEEIEGSYMFLSDTEISFVPEKDWRIGEYVLRVASKAEDLAGNNLNRPFDLDLQERPNVSEQEYYEINFTIL